MKQKTTRISEHARHKAFLKNQNKPEMWHTYIIPTLGRLRQEVRSSKMSLDYFNSRPAWDMGGEEKG